MPLARSFRVDPNELAALVEQLEAAVEVVGSRTRDIHDVLPETVANVGITLVSLSRVTGIKSGRIADIVNGKQTATPDEAVRLAHWMRDSFTDSGEPIPFSADRKPKPAKRKLEPVRDLDEEEWE